jgi:hypothetical protein
MQALFSALLGTGLLAVAASASAGDIAVAFVQPEKYTDAAYASSLPGERERNEVLRDVERHLQRLAATRLPSADALKVEVLDIDLAGSFEPVRFRPGDNMRVVRDVSGPRIKLRYTWSRGDQVLASAEEVLSDINFLRRTPRHLNDDRLRYEKAMLDDWFDRRFGQAGPGVAASQ